MHVSQYAKLKELRSFEVKKKFDFISERNEALVN